MEYEVVIPLDAVDFTDLNDMVEQACRLSGKKAQVKRQLVIVTDDLNLSMMFDSFCSSLGEASSKSGRKAAKVQKEPRAPRAPKALKEQMGRASRRIVDTGEVLSLVELKKRLDDTWEGVVIENHRGERFVVMGGELIKEPTA
ncbi:hypothetical protein FBQ81_03415 [Chloroflexi bacterium CFX6]|nr:hypothetical protein [Chloroflexi bacterium CFX6]